MSGGVDSSLTAALLVEQGYDVTGVYMKNWTQDLPGMKCPWADDLADAKRVAVQLGIDFKVFDFEKEYKHKVVDYMIDEYKRGRTPNPDIMCNQEVKFKLFLEAALEDGADMIATGHYARVEHRSSSSKSSETASLRVSNRVSTSLETRAADVSEHLPTSARLLLAADANKDQTYFLYRVTGEALARTLFPLGEYTKPQVRAMAAERGLSTATKKDSQGICFVGKIGIREFLSEYVEQVPGNIIDKATGKVLGRHDGAIFYTLGQRHGLDVGGGLPYYVAGKDMAKNEVYVTTDLNDTTLWKDTIELSEIHWINDRPADGDYDIRVRHRAKLVKASLSGTSLRLHNSERAVTAGQSVVIYDGDTCLGGGIVA
jgi:tRNA-specific 2-thiouridylase